VEAFTLDAPVTKSGVTVTYGPYNNINSSANEDFISKHQQPVFIHYNYEYPVAEVPKLKRAAEISHWGANLNIQDEIHLRNAGPASVVLGLYGGCCSRLTFLQFERACLSS
jgi:oligosaccharyltransferase complex subunit alpha (ribophorin I)